MANNFIDDYHAATLYMESPDSYIRWSSYGVLASIMRHHYFWRGNWTVYPNIYVVLYAKAAATRKDPPIVFAESLIRAVGNTKLFTGHFSMQAVIKEMSEVGHNPNTMEQILDGSATLMSREIANQFADVVYACNSLTELYDFHEKWENRILKNDGTQALKNVCINLLAASNEVLFKGVFSDLALEGGLMRRIFLVAESTKRHHTSPFKSINVDPTLKPKLIKHLEYLSRHKGQIIFNEAAEEEMTLFYESLEEPSKLDESGIMSSVHTSVMKVAMLQAASEYDFEFIITKKHVETAIDDVMKVIKNSKIVMPLAATGGAGNKYRQQLGPEILQILLKAPKHQIARETLIRRLTAVCNDIRIFDAAITWLSEQSKSILVTRLDNGEMGFKLTDSFMELYQKKVAEKEGK